MLTCHCGIGAACSCSQSMGQPVLETPCTEPYRGIRPANKSKKQQNKKKKKKKKKKKTPSS
eukprot:NODE_29151_length_455_cov_0.743902.p1 GENE.NODE_29151_length_455_cov_0.743902~~NODE_29151_length_455_cov_0.743902.p1  ORF type:complete len:61 (-),score=21.14 NODE_29151_length_455_cov_0.743902:128-310(-)